MKRLYLLLLVIIGLLVVPSVLSAPSCKVALFNFDMTFVASGKVSVLGHFTPDLASLYPYTLYCPNSWPFDTGSVSFLYAVDNSTVNGSGHVAVVGSGSGFIGEELLGFHDSCVINKTCTVEESCIFRMSNG
ncbi:MAG: hypothetical protein DRQ01_06685 [Ignavibacteriae bacterium]|nr:MAG: hypothetical protein DRQ01_06685 [Ignavibacteriota bacterium]